MKKNLVGMMLAAAALGAASTAQAGFVNGGFEDGNFNGWKVEYKKTYNPTWTVANGVPVNTHQAVIGAVADPYSPFDTPFNGNYMARLNMAQTGADMSRISQTATMLAGETALYINWGAVMQDPGHGPDDQPFFTIAVNVNGAGGGNDYFFTHTAGAGGNAGWTLTSGAYSKAGQASITGLNAGDTVEVILTVADCDLGGHFGYAYLDGIGTIAQPPPPGVPDGANTLILFSVATIGFIAFRRRR